MSAGQPVPSLQAAALSEMLVALGFGGAMAKQAAAEQDEEKLQLYAQMALRRAPAERRADIRQRLERLGLLP